MVDPRFPSMKARQLRRVVDRLGYVRVRKGSGSHQQLRAPGLPPITWAHHDGETVGPGLVHKVLCVQIGLDIEAALALVSKKRR
ncbi:MAG: type II toxin-antitoxin system HicA family toxin [Patulibacter sp.]|nr:type II toxin-antitoxin system HicA family toxin [Patulibacter sp.]